MEEIHVAKLIETLIRFQSGKQDSEHYQYTLHQEELVSELGQALEAAIQSLSSAPQCSSFASPLPSSLPSVVVENLSVQKHGPKAEPLIDELLRSCKCCFCDSPLAFDPQHPSFSECIGCGQKIDRCCKSLLALPPDLFAVESQYQVMQCPLCSACSIGGLDGLTLKQTGNGPHLKESLLNELCPNNAVANIPFWAHQSALCPFCSVVMRSM